MTRSLLAWLAPLVVALVPAAIRLWVGRALARRLDDPALPERLFASRRLLTIAFSICLALLSVWMTHVLWTIPLLVVTSLAAGYPLRKALYAETWSLPVYFWFFTRLFIAVWGFWMALMLSPLPADRPGWEGWATAAVVAIALVIWNERYGDVVRLVLGATPVDRPDLGARLAALAARTSIPAPRFDQVPLRGGVVVNALALPSIDRPGVLFSETLMTRFSDDEIVAVAAHELAHHEHFNPARLRRLRLAGIALILAGALMAPVLRAIGAAPGWQWPTAFVLVVLFYVASRGLQRQQQETASDVRAVELIGDPEPLVSALEKLHAFARLPRRWDERVERQVSHPSLANRIQAIRKAAGRAPLTLSEEAAFNAGDGSGGSVTFHADRVVWTEHDASFSLAYGAMTRLSIEAGRTGPARLIAADTKDRRWTMVLAPGDVGRAQAVLGIVDVRIAPPSATPAVEPIAPLVSALAALIALFGGQLAGAIVGFLALFHAKPPMIAAASAASLMAAALMLRDGGSRLMGANAVWPILVTTLCGVFLASVAWRTRALPSSRQTWRFVAVLAVCAVVSLVPVVSASVDWVGFHQASRAWSGFAVLAWSIAVALAARSGASARAAAALSALAGLAILVGGSALFLDRTVRDPFLRPRPLAGEVTLTSPPVAEFTIAVDPQKVWLSPGGRSIAAVEAVDEEATQIQVGRAGAALTIIDGTHVRFVNDDALIVAAADAGGTVVRRVAVDAPGAAVWEHRRPDLRLSTLSLDAHGTAWQVLGLDSQGGAVSIEGSVDGGAPHERRWTAAMVGDASPVTAIGDRLLVNEWHYRAGRLNAMWWQLSPLLGSWRAGTRIWVIGAKERVRLADSAFEASCGDQPVAGTALCSMYDGSRTHVLSIDRLASIRTIATLPGEFFAHGGGRGLLTGSFRNPAGLAALRLDSGTLLRVTAPREAYRTLVSATDDHVATVSLDPDEVTVRLYATPR